MSKEDYNIIIAFMVDQEEPIAEVYYKEEQWAEITYEFPEKFSVLFFGCTKAGYWEFPFDEAIEVLQEAKGRLAKLQRTPEQQARYDAWIKSIDDDFNRQIGIMSTEERQRIYPPFLAKETEEILSNPEMKKEARTKITDFLPMLKAIWAFSSKGYQNSFWVRNEDPMGYDSFDQSTSTFLYYAQQAIQSHDHKHIKMTTNQYNVLQGLYDMVNSYVEECENREDDAAIVSDPKWHKIREHSKLVYEELTGDKP